MNRFSTLLLTSLLACSIGSCSDDPAPPADSGVPSDTGGGADTGVCTPTPVADPTPNMTSCSAPPVDGGPVPYFQCTTDPICPRGRFMNNAMRPGFRLTYIKITQPAALASAAILSTINPTLQRGTFLWGLSFDLTAGTYRTGALNPAPSALQRGTIGRGLLDGRYAFYNDNAPAAMGMAGRYNPVSGMATLTGDRAATAMSSTVVNIPIFSDETATSVLTTLPLTNLRLSNIQITADRGCIGLASLVSGRFDECRSPWRTEDEAMMPYGQIDADITVADARNVRIDPLQTTLCNYITGVDCTMVTDLSNRPEGQRPDTMVNGMPAFHLTASFSAVSANIPAN